MFCRLAGVVFWMVTVVCLGAMVLCCVLVGFILDSRTRSGVGWIWLLQVLPGDCGVVARFCGFGVDLIVLNGFLVGGLVGLLCSFVVGLV